MSDRTGVVVPCILSLALAAWAPASALGSDASPLGGPSISEQAKAGSLISKGFKGEVLPLDAPPPIAALDLLDLDEMTESVLYALLTERASIMDGIVLGNIELLSQIETVMTVGRASEKLTIVQQGLAALSPAREWGRLRDRIAAALPETARARFRGLVDEYEQTRYGLLREAGEVEHKFEYRMMRHWEDIAWEIERAAERVFDDDGEGDAWIALLTDRLGLSPDQEGQIRAMGERFYIETKGRPSETDEIAFVNKVRTVLTVEQRWKFTAMLLKGELDPDKGMD